ncbi:hypothetical protein PHYBLDRAFT_147461 [Phycomyces blakesleeanus NRRL 1555(-)]|uniref:Uncharacterized protein n=1 Tax=Phycomyces blakesleeanus (strain ATCC 8743b / DSM 1359 / FGSC 10004 / NBRC 33097 / NRRL 1555) TaxID=763407 RepID=A0A163A866_PHYB8|nr:hypothetical protein PHYBLDRAFT_147461 [Phycomyces blakesleeanus NRRL 1555(-)]OAD71711.1 hypothetical protein PHYBLDRAFT_147461 [Phycomyces blakesleeanus NRRL 1555(-)]|eukprot:XP_018289751.1 hypothetical protein PHYBLDRAFT_147461 [Phycomyces blakesleeanus NRRL 1555(-)]
MSTPDSMPTTRNYGSVSAPAQVDEENPTQDPFTSPAESSSTNYIRKFSRHTLPKS